MGSLRPGSMLVSVINWNNSSATNACLLSIAGIAKQDQPDVYLIDNDSKREALTLKEDSTKNIRSLMVIHNDHNKGFAGGHNDAIRYARENGYEYICLLNNDTQIVDPSVFKKLEAALSADDTAVAAAPTILSTLEPPIIWFAGGDMDMPKASTQHKRVGELLADNDSKNIEKVSFLTGCCLMISLKKAPADALLSEDYFLYWEDADWCARMLKNSLNLLYVPDARLLHYTSSSLGVRSPQYGYYNVRNRLLFAQKWSAKSVLFSCMWTGVKIVGLSLKRPLGTPKTFWYIVRALIDGQRGKTGAFDS